MVKKLLGAAAVAAIAYAFVPAHAAKVGIGCSGESLAKAEGPAETMPDGPAKFTAQREIAAAQDAMLKGTMSGCAMHLGRAMRAETMAQAPYAGTSAEAPYHAGTPTQPSYAGASAQAPYPDTMAQAPAGTAYQAPSQPTQGWQPVKPAI
jgi:hypothetical protein